MAKLTRRQFLTIGSAAAATSVLSGCTLQLQRVEYLESFSEPPEEGLPGQDLWYATTCRQCSAGCGLIVRVSNGRARKVEGNPLHPLNRGKLCARGQAVLQELYDPDRLRNAVRQRGRGTLDFEPLLWDNALYELTLMLRDATPGAVALLLGNPSTHLGFLGQQFMAGLGAPTPVVYSLADELDGRATLAQVGSQLYDAPLAPSYDLASADVVFSFGANFLETWLSPVSQSRSYAAMRRQPLGKRGYLVQFETRMSSTAACADEWVPVRPGTEGLVALALGKLVGEQTGRSEARYARVDVAEMAEASGVPRETLAHLAHLFAAFERPVAIAGNSLCGQRNSLPALQAVQALNGLMGRFGELGGVRVLRDLETPALATRPVSRFADLRGLIAAMQAGQVEVLMVHGCNPAFELPLEAGFVEALNNVPLVVCFNPAVDETVALADLVLPDHTNLESWGYHRPLGADRALVSGLQPVMQPLYDTRATGDVLLALAQRLGGALRTALPWDNEASFVEQTVAPLGLDWSAWKRQGGWWRTQPDEAGEQFNLPAELAPGLPVFEGERADYPFHLLLYPSIALGDGRGANKPWLQETPDPMTTVAWQSWIEIHPETAEQLELADDDVVRVTSPAGEIEAIVYTYHGIPQDVVAMAIGRGHAHYGRFASGFGSNPLALLVAAENDETGALVWGATRVKLSKTGRKHALPRLESAAGVEYLRGNGEH